MTTIGGFYNDICRAIYINARKYVKLLVRAGKIPAKDANLHWAKIVSEKLTKAGAKVHKHILKQLPKLS